MGKTLVLLFAAGALVLQAVAWGTVLVVRLWFEPWNALFGVPLFAFLVPLLAILFLGTLGLAGCAAVFAAAALPDLLRRSRPTRSQSQ